MSICLYINTQQFKCRENLLRCGNSCSHYNYYNPIYIVKTSLQVFPGRFSPGRVFAHYPGRFFPWNSSPGDLSTALSPRDSEVPGIASPGFGKPPTTLVVFPAPINGLLTYLVPRKGGYPQIASINRIDDRPDLSDVGWTSPYASHTIRSRPFG